MFELELATMTKKKQLECFLRDKRVFMTSDIIAWDSQNYSTRSDRTKRDLVKEGKIRRYTEEEKIQAGKNTKQAVYVWIGE